MANVERDPAAEEKPLAHAGDLACFEVHENVFGIDVRRIRQIVRSAAITPLPGAPAWIEGVIDLRDAMVPVVDLGLALGAEPIARAARSRIAVVDVDGFVIGLRVGRALEVLSLEGRAIEPPPAIALQAGYDPVAALLRRDDGSPVLELALERLVARLLQGTAREGGGA
ncbi:MAG TPA: chemotaxis protein CheW [Myxococcota bacterium]|jgi:purine-binding chemotaxis protein CheW|nr:chemotaxis protein CheW [Myxococcota bacterium]